MQQPLAVATVQVSLFSTAVLLAMTRFLAYGLEISSWPFLSIAQLLLVHVVLAAGRAGPRHVATCLNFCQVLNLGRAVGDFRIEKKKIDFEFLPTYYSDTPILGGMGGGEGERQRGRERERGGGGGEKYLHQPRIDLDVQLAGRRHSQTSRLLLQRISFFIRKTLLDFILGNAEHSGASLSETLSDVPGQHSAQRRAKASDVPGQHSAERRAKMQCKRGSERCEICPGPGHFGDGHVHASHATLAYAWEL